MDRRAVFFVGAAFACALLVPVTDNEFRWVPIATAIVYIVLALASFLDARSRKHSA
jgi:hypothetical protein